jgi:hypothetical protein
MIYAEYFEWDRQLPFELFRHLGDQAAWTAAEDKLVGSFGRTMRFGPRPGYLAFWQCKGMKRLDEWEAHFNAPTFQHDWHERATHKAINLSRGGCYDELIEGPPADRNGLFAIEFFAAGAAVGDKAIADHFRARAARRRDATLNFVLRRIGRLGPDPGHLAVWGFADYVALEPFARDCPDDDPFRPAEVGVYRWFGREIL